ncbi:immunity 53 family protein [Hymenobacter canadensis]|uniref:Immunity 53 family protein n=1 Tax=Hymenobacter canadensis TaxID=2999067 RepID=A0ABY7LWI7_9BACT|nr:immunity 53 family protein [Hymenobacter canadensis]WBA44218.1 immunity 53 family protein [Hymenobacter canadensis]WBA44249.1 immunity 53 family protein [Hymenobacter canadensis]
METLTWLQDWYRARCDGEWEFREGIKLLSTSNPGWSVEINVSDTPLEDAYLPLTKFDRSESDWYGYFLEDALFVGSGDPAKLEVILRVFRNLIENGIPSPSNA